MNQEVTHAARRGKTYRMAMTALMAAVTCVLAPMSIPIGPVPISFTNLAIYLSLYLLDWKKGTLSYLIYLLLGLVGLPVFSGFTGGLAKLAGPTGGYIIGFIPMAIIAGIVIDKFSGNVPNAFQQLAAGQHHPSIIEKHQQQPIFQCRQVDFLAVFMYRSPHRIHPQIANLKHRLRPSGAAQHAFNSRNHLHRTEGLNDVIICAHVQPHHHASFVIGRGEKNHRKLIPLLQGFT